MTRLQATAYVVFSVIVCFVFTKMSLHTKEYGARLKRVRELAKRSLDDWTDIETETDIKQILIDLEQKTIIEHTGLQENNEELMRVVDKMSPNAMIFEHLPDSTNTSHTVAIFRVDNKTHASVAYTNT